MPIQALTRKELESKVPIGSVHQEYLDFFQNSRVGSGGRLNVKKEGVTRQTVKNRLNKAAEFAGKSIKFLRSPQDTVVFQVVE